MAFESMTMPLGQNVGRASDQPWALSGKTALLVGTSAMLLAGVAWMRFAPPAPAPLVVVSSAKIVRADKPSEKAHNLAGGLLGQAADLEKAAVNAPAAGARPNPLLSAFPSAKIIRVSEKWPEGADARVGERGQHGILPKIGTGGLLPRQVYARAFAPTQRPKIAVVVTGMGISERSTQEALIRLPRDMTLAFAPYGRDLDQHTLKARKEGFELLLQVPMEPVDYPQSDPGPHTLRLDSAPEENADRLAWLMSRFPGYVGLTNFMGSKIMTQSETYAAFLGQVKARGLLFVDDGSVRGSKTLPLAERLGTPVLAGDLQHDAAQSKALSSLLSEAEQMATKNGQAIIYVPALSANIVRLAAWATEIEKRGLALAPVSAVLAAQNMAR